jgi:hypothetical protein
MCLTLCIVRQLTGEKITNKCTVIVYLLLKFIFIYLFIYLFHRHGSAIP